MSEPWPSVEDWLGQLLRSIHMLSAQCTRLVATPVVPVGDQELDEEQQATHTEAVNAVEGLLEQTEQTALSAGVPAGWIADMRELGARGARPAPAPEPGSPVSVVPVRDAVSQQFYVEMLSVDLWHLERMAGLAAARTDRLATGRWSISTDPDAEGRFAEAMARRWERVNALARAAELTDSEAERLWGAGADGIRHFHAGAVGTWTEASLMQAWSDYAHSTPDLAIPPYVPAAPGADAQASTPTAPTPQQMIAAASAALRSSFIDNAITAATHDHAEIASEAGAANWDASTDVGPDQVNHGSGPGP
ncbi:hypothetical protein [Nocardia cyriacigeorgica]|uniref:Uncharacterized protein n=1 Tax=Nocardia cyriacigeorgica TaxID=135487 RepID=A0A5R8ND48_9NOCA|nr:hypothetical protein [Nocardia cyriacigeorgica]MBF6427870.1 hypothetical protein [Nocardia cyriacigeorgica]TLF72447.1 hypothetical protein FEK34_29280 [Nocardia cyriacigeorgica]